MACFSCRFSRPATVTTVSSSAWYEPVSNVRSPTLAGRFSLIEKSSAAGAAAAAGALGAAGAAGTAGAAASGRSTQTRQQKTNPRAASRQLTLMAILPERVGVDACPGRYHAARRCQPSSGEAGGQPDKQ